MKPQKGENEQGTLPCQVCGRPMHPAEAVLADCSDCVRERNREWTEKARRLHQDERYVLRAIASVLNTTPLRVKRELILHWMWVGDPGDVAKALKEGKPAWLPAAVDTMKLLRSKDVGRSPGPLTAFCEYVARVRRHVEPGFTGITMSGETVKKWLEKEGIEYIDRRRGRPRKG